MDELPIEDLPEPEGYQAKAFVVTELLDRYISDLLGAVEAEDSELQPILLYLRVADETVWHRFFLDEGIAYWHLWDAETIEAEFAALKADDEIQMRFVDYRESIGGLPQTVKSAGANRDPASDNAQIEIFFGSGIRLILTADPADTDGNNHLAFESS